MTADVAEPAVAAPAILATPCVASDAEGRHCTVGLLLGAACCPDGSCWSCTTQAAWTRRSGFSDYAVFRSIVRTRRGLLDQCPLCGFPPPPPITESSPLPRLDRSGRTASGSWECRTCGRPLPQRRRHYCSDACWREHVRRTEMDGNEIATPTAPRVFRARP
ncbi:MAG: hypothetical protein K8T90_08750 [Planctomycetes bacterium]|nr:hypothetical protein [Planctomycetota bacterium]